MVLLLTPEAFLPLRALALHFHASMEGMAAAGRVCDLLEIPPPRAAAGSGATAGADLRQQDITLDAVCLAYPGRDRPALDGVSLTIAPGERILVTGPSGAGKSSLLALLLRFTEPSGGRIEAGGVPLSSIATPAWRRQVAWVPQRPVLMPGTLAANIALGEAGASRDAIASAAGLAGADGFIRALPDGYDTEIEERGARLSIGQRQLVAFARALLADPRLLILDEATSSVDIPTEARIEQALERLLWHRTSFVVAHRLSTIRRADLIVVLEYGEVIEAGTHEDLISRRGRYFSLYDDWVENIA